MRRVELGQRHVGDNLERLADVVEHIAEVPTAYRAKSSIFVPELKRLFVAVSGKGKPDARLGLQIYEVQ